MWLLFDYLFLERDEVTWVSPAMVKLSRLNRMRVIFDWPIALADYMNLYSFFSMALNKSASKHGQHLTTIHLDLVVVPMPDTINFLF